MVTLILLTALGFGIVILGAHFLVNGACSLAKRLAVSELVIGLTVVAFGTSLPELSVNITASIKGDAGIALGNIFGSNIANIFLILGISSIIYPLAVTKGTVWKEIPLSLLAAIMVGILVNDHLIDGSDFSVLTRIDGLVLLSFFIIFLFYSAGIAGGVAGIEEQIPMKHYGTMRICILIAIGLCGLIVGSRWIVVGAAGLAEKLGVSQSLIGLTIVAVGTSLPELATSAMAAYKKNPDIAVGNVVGSNIFNIFFVLGVSSIIKPIPFDTKCNIDVGVVIAASLLLFICMFTGKRRTLDRWEGGVFLGLYAGYILYLIMRK
jgi:cation:H+ antiporter